jgi:hypothetical protein
LYLLHIYKSVIKLINNNKIFTINYKLNHNDEISAKIFATIPANESSVNPITTNSVSNYFINDFPFSEFDILFNVNAANLFNFY